MAAELVLSRLNGRRLGSLRDALESGRPGTLFKLTKTDRLSVMALRLTVRRGGPPADHLASLHYLASGLAFRFAWVGAGRTSARDDAQVARAAREPAAGR
jgi:hypothetical protein